MQNNNCLADTHELIRETMAATKGDKLMHTNLRLQKWLIERAMAACQAKRQMMRRINRQK